MSSGFKKKILFPILTVCMGFIFALLVLEILLRLTGIGSSQGLHSVDENTYQKIPGIWSPEQDFVWKELPALPYHIRINSLGYRGSEISVDKQEDEFRIFIAGDSYTFGSYVDNDDTMPAQVESHLNSACDGNRITVINAGILGSSITAQSHMIERGFILDPDLVALVFYDNDLADLADPLWDRMVENRAIKSQFPVSILWPLLRNTAVWNFYLRMREVFRTSKTIDSTDGSGNQPEGVSQMKVPGSVDQNELKEIYQDSLYKLADRLSEQQIPFVFTVYPGHLHIRGQPVNDAPVWAEQTATAKSITTLNLEDALIQGLSADVDAGFLLPHDGHPSKLGHSLAGKAMAEFLLQQPEVKAFCL